MKNALLALLLLCTAAVTTWGQTSVFDIVKARQEFWLGTPLVKVTSITQDTTLASATHLQLPTALVVKTYARKLGGRPVSTTAPTTGQVMAWDGSKWKPTTVSGGGGLFVDTLYNVPSRDSIVWRRDGVVRKFQSSPWVKSNAGWAIPGQIGVNMPAADNLFAGGYILGIQQPLPGTDHEAIRVVSPGGSNLVKILFDNDTTFSIKAAGAPGTKRLTLEAPRLDLGADSLKLVLGNVALPTGAARKILLVNSYGSVVAQAGVLGTQIDQMGANTGDFLKWDGTKWVPATITAGGSQTYEEFPNVTGTTITPADAIPASDRALRINLYRTGVRMTYLTDYTISGSDIVLTLAATNENFVLIINN